MSELDDKLNSILSNPAMMQQIMSLAQALNHQSETQQPQQSPPPPQPQNTMPSTERLLNPNMLSRMASLMQRGSIDKDQQSLLRALRPYLSRQKLEKLERAMHAAKMAGIASEMVNSQSSRR